MIFLGTIGSTVMSVIYGQIRLMYSVLVFILFLIVFQIVTSLLTRLRTLKNLIQYSRRGSYVHFHYHMRVCRRMDNTNWWLLRKFLWIMTIFNILIILHVFNNSHKPFWNFIWIGFIRPQVFTLHFVNEQIHYIHYFDTYVYYFTIVKFTS